VGLRTALKKDKENTKRMIDLGVVQALEDANKRAIKEVPFYHPIKRARLVKKYHEQALKDTGYDKGDVWPNQDEECGRIEYKGFHSPKQFC
jgi:hypothetical protein